MKGRRGQVAATGRWRFLLVATGLCALLLLLVGRIALLQLVDVEYGRQFLQHQGDMRAVRTAEVPAYRGLITDRGGEPLAVSTPVISLWADPAVLLPSGQASALARALEQELDVDASQLAGRLERYAGKRFMYLQRHVAPPRARAVLQRNIPGVHGQREYQRYYPAGEVAAQLVGFTNLDGRGIDGLELAYNDWLQGVPGRKKYIKDLHGEVARDIGVLQAPHMGRDLALSIDLRLQYLQHRELQRAVRSLGAVSGSVVTLDSHTGEVLAMVNYPVYNPNSRSNASPENMRNRAMTDVYEPGSTMKALTLVAALESGRYTPQTVVDTSPGYIRVGRKTYPDPRNYGPITLTRILQKSSQVGITRIALDIGHEPILDVFRRFGIGSPPGTGFPGERAGTLPVRSRWYATERVSLAFGYGIETTPLQLARAYAVFANGGVRVPVSLLSLAGEEPQGERVLSSRIASQVLDMLYAVTDDEGTASKARVAGYRVGGKTGTVHKVGPDGYDRERYVALFAGIAPLDDPRFVTVVVINEPQGDTHGGGSAAAPVFSAVAEGALRLLNVAPTRLHAERDAGQSRPGGAA